jgi:hypothetical protein
MKRFIEKVLSSQPLITITPQLTEHHLPMEFDPDTVLVVDADHNRINFS